MGEPVLESADPHQIRARATLGASASSPTCPAALPTSAGPHVPALCMAWCSTRRTARRRDSDARSTAPSASPTRSRIERRRPFVDGVAGAMSATDAPIISAKTACVPESGPVCPRSPRDVMSDSRQQRASRVRQCGSDLVDDLRDERLDGYHPGARRSSDGRSRRAQQGQAPDERMNLPAEALALPAHARGRACAGHVRHTHRLRPRRIQVPRSRHLRRARLGAVVLRRLLATPARSASTGSLLVRQLRGGCS